MNQDFVAHLQANNSSGSNKADSYVRALELLTDLLRKPNPLFPSGIDIWTLTTPAEVLRIYEYALNHQNDPQGIFLASGVPPSYGMNGYYSAALKAYADFLGDSNFVSASSEDKTDHQLPLVWISALEQLEKSRSKDNPHYKPLAVVAMLRQAAMRPDGQVSFLQYEAEWEALEATLGTRPSGKAYMPFFHVAAGEHIWELFARGTQQPLDRKDRPKSRAQYVAEGFIAVLREDFRSVLHSKHQIAEVERRALAMAQGERVTQHNLSSANPHSAPTSNPVELENRARELLRSDDVIIPVGNPRPERTYSQTTAYVREPAVVAYVLRQARERCELCGFEPFRKEDGSVYLEIHHVHRLADGGSDTICNTVALCPNCHRRCHHGSDKAALVETLKAKIKRLSK